MLTIHQYHMSPFNEKLRRMLRYKGVPFEERFWLISEQREVRKHNPTGKLPAVEHDGRWICDSTDAAHYIEEVFPSPALIPAAADQRALVHILEDWADESLYFYEMHMRFTVDNKWQGNIARMLEREGWLLKSVLAGRFPGMIRKGIRKITATQGIGRKSEDQLLIDCRRHIEAVDGLLGQGDWLLDELTLADLSVYGMLQAFRDAELLLGLLQAHPVVIAWMERVERATGEVSSDRCPPG